MRRSRVPIEFCPRRQTSISWINGRPPREHLPLWKMRLLVPARRRRPVEPMQTLLLGRAGQPAGRTHEAGCRGDDGAGAPGVDADLSTFKQIGPPFSLRVIPVLDLYPARSTVARDVFAGRPLRHNPFQVELAGLRKQSGSVSLEMIQVQKPVYIRWYADLPQSILSLEKRQAAEVLAVEPQQTQRVEIRLTPAKHQLVELRSAERIQTDDLAIDDRVLNLELRDCRLQRAERLVFVPPARDEPALCILNVGELAKPIELDLVDPGRGHRW